MTWWLAMCVAMGCCLTCFPSSTAWCSPRSSALRPAMRKAWFSAMEVAEIIFFWQEKLWKGPFYNNPLLVHWWKYVDILVKPNMILRKFMEYIYFLSSCFCSWTVAHEPSKLRLAHVGQALDTPLFITCHHLPKTPVAIPRDIPTRDLPYP